MKQTSPANDVNLAGAPAVEKVRKIAEAARSCLFGTIHDGRSLMVRPMAVQAVDEDGRLWFLSGRDSNKNHQLQHDSQVQLLFANPGSSEFMSLTGRAHISDDRALREKYWTAMAKTWFPGGVDDPQLTVISVLPEDGHYWSTTHGRAVSLLKMATGAVTGRKMDIGVEGAVRP